MYTAYNEYQLPTTADVGGGGEGGGVQINEVQCRIHASVNRVVVGAGNGLSGGGGGGGVQINEVQCRIHASVNRVVVGAGNGLSTVRFQVTAYISADAFSIWSTQAF